MRCNHPYRGLYFHTLIDCLLPMYDTLVGVQLPRMLAITFATHARGAMRPCKRSTHTTHMPMRMHLHVDGNVYARSMHRYDKFVLADEHASGAINHTACVRADAGFLLTALTALTAPRVRVFDGSRCSDSHIGKQGSLAAAENSTFSATTAADAITFMATRAQQLRHVSWGLHVHLLRVSHFAEAPRTGVILLLERLRSRRWTNMPEILAALRGWLRSSNALGSVYAQEQARPAELVVFNGTEDAISTMELFARADAVLGYHGAGLANNIFIPRNACVVEVSLWLDTNGSEPWRETPHSRILSWNPRLHWRTHRLAIGRALEAFKSPMAGIKQTKMTSLDRTLLHDVHTPHKRTSLAGVWGKLSTGARDIIALAWDAPPLNRSDLEVVTEWMSTCMSWDAEGSG